VKNGSPPEESDRRKEVSEGRLGRWTDRLLYDLFQNDADHSLCRIFVTIKRWLIYMCYKY
jgi:hypothetical protein